MCWDAVGLCGGLCDAREDILDFSSGVESCRAGRRYDGRNHVRL